MKKIIKDVYNACIELLIKGYKPEYYHYILTRKMCTFNMLNVKVSAHFTVSFIEYTSLYS